MPMPDRRAIDALMNPTSPLETLANGSVSAYTPTWRERTAGLLQDAIEKMGGDRYWARKVGETIAGGPGSNLPMKMGLLDPTMIGSVFGRQEASVRGTPMGPGSPSFAAGLAAAVKPQNQAAARAQAVNYEGGWFRGGPKPADNRMTGPWYTRNQEEAADYARRFGSGADVREYAIPSGGMLKLDRSYDPRLADDLAAKAEATLGDGGAKLAKLIRSSYKEGERPSGMELWRAASKTVGDDAAAGLFGSLGFRSVVGVNSPDYVRLFPGATARDAQRAAFDPNKLHLDNIMAGAGGLGLLGAALRSQDDE